MSERRWMRVTFLGGMVLFLLGCDDLSWRAPSSPDGDTDSVVERETEADPDGAACRENETGCDGSWKTMCREGEWQPITDCSDFDKICVGGACVHPEDGDAELDAELDAEPDGDATDQAELEESGDGDTTDQADLDETSDGDATDQADLDETSDGDAADQAELDETGDGDAADEAELEESGDGEGEFETDPDAEIIPELDPDPEIEPESDEEPPPTFSCAEGICTDPATGFEWQETPTGGTMTWDDAITHCRNLDLGGTGWRLPTISELRTLVRGCSATQPGGSCGVTDQCLVISCYTQQLCNDACPYNSGPAAGCYWPDQLNGICNFYWSSSLREDDTDRRWGLGFGYADVNHDTRSFLHLVRCVRDTTPGFVRINADSFTMGSPEGEAGRQEDETQHSVTLTYSFEMSAKETTQGEFQSLMTYNPSYFKTCDGGTGSACPVEQVSWHEALKYANLLSVQKGYAECYDCTGTQPDFTCSLKTAYSKPQDCPGFRLPTESEWEYAARAGTTAAYHDGQDSDSGHLSCETPFHLTDIAWYCGNASNTTHPAGGKTANAWGLYDMSGNVCEWCWDWYQAAYESDVGTNPVGPGSGSYRVGRGGFWNYYAQYCRSAGRSSYSPGYRSGNIGFRLVRTRP